MILIVFRELRGVGPRKALPESTYASPAQATATRGAPPELPMRYARPAASR